MGTRLRQILASEGFRIAASPLDASVKEAMKKGQFVGDPKIGSYTVAPEGIVVEVTVSVVVPPSKALAAAPPKQTLKMVFGKPELLSEIPESVLKTIPFKAMKPAQFTTFVKKMGGLGQYSDEVLRALLEGRSNTPAYGEGDAFFAAIPADEWSQSDFDTYVGGAQGEVDYWGREDQEASLKIKGGVITGRVRLVIKWESTKSLTIKKDVPDHPYVGLDPVIHGEEAKSNHPKLRGMNYEDPLEKGYSGDMSGRVEVLPKGTPGVQEVSVSRQWNIGKIPLASLSRKELEALVTYMAQ